MKITVTVFEDTPDGDPRPAEHPFVGSAADEIAAAVRATDEETGTVQWPSCVASYDERILKGIQIGILFLDRNPSVESSTYTVDHLARVGVERK